MYAAVSDVVSDVVSGVVWGVESTFIMRYLQMYVALEYATSPVPCRYRRLICFAG